jgi:hypothetical protein
MAKSSKWNIINASRLRYLLAYDPNTGIFISRRPQRGRRVGSVMGTRNNGYIIISVDDLKYQAHRLAWLYMTGELPRCDIDHINRDRSDNRWSNLRTATRSQNNANSPTKANNRSGYKGASWHKLSERWQASLTIGGKQVFLGYHESAENAHAAYIAAADKHFGEFSRSS